MHLLHNYIIVAHGTQLHRMYGMNRLTVPKNIKSQGQKYWLLLTFYVRPLTDDVPQSAKHSSYVI